MRQPATLALAAALLAAATASARAQPAPASSAGLTAAECDVWSRERSFAQSVADHDAAAFAEHLHPGAVFLGGPEPVRGRDAVVAAWAPLVKGDRIRLRWHPEQVVIGGDADIALSTGPYWLEDPSPDANPRFRIGRFISTWRRDAAGTWHVLYDGGGNNRTEPASAEDVAKLVASLPQACPRA
jgi:ketosteroid isomerase-like protein